MFLAQTSWVRRGHVHGRELKSAIDWYLQPGFDGPEPLSLRQDKGNAAST